MFYKVQHYCRDTNTSVSRDANASTCVHIMQRFLIELIQDEIYILRSYCLIVIVLIKNSKLLETYLTFCKREGVFIHLAEVMN